MAEDMLVRDTRTRVVRLRILRQDGAQARSRWEDFLVPYHRGMNVISCLMAIQKNPVNAAGEKTLPVVWEMNCLEEICGACTMLVNGKVRQSCAALVDNLEQPIELRPMTKFPVVRDLVVDRSRMFENLKKVKAWVPIDGSYDLGPGPRMPERERAIAYELARCMSCGCCLEVCPQVNPASAFIGPAAINQVRLMNAHPTGAMNKHERLEAVMGQGGITDCGNAQNCVHACPKQIPLTDSIADVGRQATVYSFQRFFGVVEAGAAARSGPAG